MKELLQQAASDAASAAQTPAEPGKDSPFIDEGQKDKIMQSNLHQQEAIPFETAKENKEEKNKGRATWDRSMLFL